MQTVIRLGWALCMVLVCCVPVPAAAQDPEFRLDIDRLNLQKGVSGKMVVSLVNAQGAQILAIESLENFDVLSQSQSTSTSIVGSEVSYQQDVFFTVMPKAAGQFSIKALIQYDGLTYETNALKVTVAESSADAGEPVRDLFITTNLSHAEAYLGEKIIVTYELYSRYGVENFGFLDFASIDGAIVRDVPMDQLRAEYVYLEGTRYEKYEAKRLILDPIVPGLYTIPSFSFQANVLSDNGAGTFGGFGGLISFSEPAYLQTEARELTVKPLPSDGRPAGFSGIVGDLALEGRYSREELNYGDSLTLRVVASGFCNLDGLTGVLTEGLSGFAAYETQANVTESIENNQYYIQKAFEVILVPEQTGVIDAASLSISFFDPVAEEYRMANIPGVSIAVLGDMPKGSGEGGEQAAVEKVTIDQVNYTDASDGFFTIRIPRPALFEALVGLVLLLALAAAALWLLSNRKRGDPALRSLYKRLKASRDPQEAYDLLNDLLKRCCGVSVKASSRSAVRSGISDACLASQVIGIMDYMESQGEKNCAELKKSTQVAYRRIVLLRKSGGNSRKLVDASQ